MTAEINQTERPQDTVRRYAQRVLQLEQLAEDMLASFIPGGDGHRARVGQIQIAKWRAILDGVILPAPSIEYDIVDCRCTHPRCARADSGEVYRLTGSCTNCRTGPLTGLFTAGHEKSMAICPSCGVKAVSFTHHADAEPAPGLARDVDGLDRNGAVDHAGHIHTDADPGL